jgi:hypothetical protein
MTVWRTGERHPPGGVKKEDGMRLAIRDRHRLSSLVAVSTASIVCGVFGSPVLARTVAAAEPTHATTLSDSESSPYFAGYQVQTSGTFADGSVTFVVPAAKCTTQEEMSGDAGMTEGITDNSNFLIGVDTECFRRIKYHVSAGPDVKKDTYVSPGDRVTVSFSQSGSTVALSLRDLTSGKSYESTLDDYVGDGFLIFGITVDPDGVVPTFVNTKLVDATVDSVPLGEQSPTVLTMVSSRSGKVMVLPSPIHRNGTTFSLTFERSH